MTCPDCTEATRQPWDVFTDAPCCKARGLGQLFLGKGESGRRLRQACEQAGVSVQQVRDAWARDAMNEEHAS